MTTLIDGITPLLDPLTLLCLGLGVIIGTFVGMFPGVTGSMAVALAAGFTLTLEPVQGLAVLLTIYIASQFGDRIPAILVNTPGTPAAISTTFDGYPMAQKGQAGLALVVSAVVSAIGIFLSMLLFIFFAQPIAGLALSFGPAEMFALVVFGLTMMVSVSSQSILKGLIAGGVGLLLATVGRDPITGDQRFTFGVNDLNSGIPFIAVIIGLFGIAELFNQIATHRPHAVKPISELGRWFPNKQERRTIIKPLGAGAAVGGVVGVVPAAGGDIAGLIGWDRARRLSKNPEKFGKGSLEGLVAADTASTATVGGSMTTTMALGIPGDAVMAVMIGSMVIWGLQPGPSLLANNPDLVVTMASIVLIAAVISLAVSMVRMQSMVKILRLHPQYLWSSILIFCIIGTYATSNSIYVVIVMLIAGAVGFLMKRTGFPPGPVVLGLLLGELAESNLRRALLIDGPTIFIERPIAAALLTLTVLSLGAPVARRLFRQRRRRTVRAAAHEETTTP